MSGKMRLSLMVWTMMLGLAVVFAGETARASEEMGKDDRVKVAEVKKEMNDALQTLKEYSIDKKEEGMAKAEKILKKTDTQIDKLENESSEKWQDMSEASRKKYQKALRELREKRNDIAEWYGGMKYSSAAAWEEMKKGFVESYQSLQEAFDKASEKY